MGFARKKPVVVEFMHFTGGPSATNALAVVEWIQSNHSFARLHNGFIYLKTLESGEGTQRADEGDYIIKGVNGEFYPCKPDIFVKTYDVVGG